MEVLQRGDDCEWKAVKSRKQHLRNRGYEGEGGDDEEGERGGEEHDRAHEQHLSAQVHSALLGGLREREEQRGGWTLLHAAS